MLDRDQCRAASVSEGPVQPDRTAYRNLEPLSRETPEITNSLNERRKWLRRILSKLNRLKRNLSPINEDAVAGLCNSLREIHRPTPAPFSAGERIQLPISSADFVRWKIADPGEALEHLAGSL